MNTIAVTHARRCLSQLLDRVAHGEECLITLLGKPSAMLVPFNAVPKRDVSQIVREMLAYRDAHGPRLGKDCSLRDFIEEGRRFGSDLS